MEETGLALTVAGGLLLCGGVLWLVISKAGNRSALPSLGAVLFSVVLTAAGVSLWLAAAFGADEGQPDIPQRRSNSGVGGSVISLSWEEAMQTRKTT